MGCGVDGHAPATRLETQRSKAVVTEARGCRTGDANVANTKPVCPSASNQGAGIKPGQPSVEPSFLA